MNAGVRLSKMVEKGTIPHSLLFAGPKGSGKSKAAIQFAGDVICLHDPHNLHRTKLASGNHPDIHLFHPEGKTGIHSIESLRGLTREVAMCPNEAHLQFFIIHDAERMLPTSSNALLKTFEEPTPRSVIILLSPRPDKLLPTVLSRCQKIDFWTPPVRDKTPLQEQFLALLIKGPTYKELEEISNTLDQEKKEWEKNLRKNLAADPSPAEKATLEKEVEGAVTLKFQESAFSLLEVVLEWYRDRTLLEVEGSEEHLFFPEHREKLKATPYLPFANVSKAVSETRLALERSLKLSTCLEALILKLHPFQHRSPNR